VQQPLGFDADALADQSGLGQMRAQRRSGVAVATVDRGQGLKR
jgi:hypothetical protein